MASPIPFHYQPILDLNSEEIVGVEALMRRDGVPPSRAQLEELSRDHEQAADVSADVCLQALDLIGALPGACEWYVSVNVPSDILGSGLLLERLAISEYSPDILRRFVIEVTERDPLHDKAWEAIKGARKLGIRLAIDDFGMGRNGLDRLLKFEHGVDIIKIDKTFVDRLAPAPAEERRGQKRVKEARRHAERVIRAIASVSSIMRTRSVAEGIERREQAAILRAVGVDFGQGWLWHEAMPREDLLALAGLASEQSS